MSEASTIALADELEGVLPPFRSTKLIGHERCFDLLLKQAANDRLPSGLLLHGPQGIGKATLAYQLAVEVLAKTGDEPRARVVEQVGEGVHPNLYSLRRQPRDSGTGFYTEIRVDDVRKTLRKLQQTRGRAGHRFLIVDAVDDCNRNAANALLKTLEEPPSQTHIVLISHRPGRLLPTIRSRCQAHALRTLSNENVRQVLRGTDMDGSDIEEAVSLCGGKPRRGFQALAMGRNELLISLENWLKAPVGHSGDNLLKLAETLADKKNAMANSFAREMILEWIAQNATGAAQVMSNNRQVASSANALWEQANMLFEQTDTYNLDAKQCLIILFDQIIAHAQLTRSNS